MNDSTSATDSRAVEAAIGPSFDLPSARKRKDRVIGAHVSPGTPLHEGIVRLARFHCLLVVSCAVARSTGQTKRQVEGGAPDLHLTAGDHRDWRQFRCECQDLQALTCRTDGLAGGRDF